MNFRVSFPVSYPWLLVVLTSPVWAQTCPIPTVTNHDDAVPALDEMRLKHCLTGPAQTLGQLHDSINALDARHLGVQSLKNMDQRWHLPNPTANTDVKEWQGKGLLLFLHTPNELDLDDRLCAKTTTAQQCQADLESAVQVYSLSAQVHAALESSARDRIDEVGRTLKLYDERWTAFHTKSLALLPWELALNNVFYRSAAQGFSGTAGLSMDLVASQPGIKL